MTITSAPYVHQEAPDLTTACGLPLADLTGDATYSDDPAAVDCPDCKR